MFLLCKFYSFPDFQNSNIAAVVLTFFFVQLNPIFHRFVLGASINYVDRILRISPLRRKVYYIRLFSIVDTLGDPLPRLVNIVYGCPLLVKSLGWHSFLDSSNWRWVIGSSLSVLMNSLTNPTRQYGRQYCLKWSPTKIN